RHEPSCSGPLDYGQRKIGQGSSEPERIAAKHVTAPCQEAGGEKSVRPSAQYFSLGWNRAAKYSAKATFRAVELGRALRAGKEERSDAEETPVDYWSSYRSDRGRSLCRVGAPFDFP